MTYVTAAPFITCGTHTHGSLCRALGIGCRLAIIAIIALAIITITIVSLTIITLAISLAVTLTITLTITVATVITTTIITALIIVVTIIVATIVTLTIIPTLSHHLLQRDTPGNDHSTEQRTRELVALDTLRDQFSRRAARYGHSGGGKPNREKGDGG
ncbi:hypothetical protein B0T21DRAFT_449711 [Apiosordaria backusii]|uniref:Uncharacterized protein n=1 Tax=Apiosordaria backusii TaxID=314023 RepID=A0AA40BSN1_9PEZI|nr:hypothetical protein B0T21DRAFT_449711 [Apiosordaria backusii]